MLSIFLIQGHNFADALWAKGNCWCTMVILEILELLKLDLTESVRCFLCETLEAQCLALKWLQSDSRA